MIPRLVIFDFHNTLFHADRWFRLETQQLASAVAEHLASLGCARLPTVEEKRLMDSAYRLRRLEVHASGVEMRPVPALVSLLAEAGIEADDWMVMRSLDALEYGCLSGAFPLPGIRQCVVELAEMGARMAVLSNALYSPFLSWSLQRFNMLSFFQKVVTSVDAGYYKSDPRLFMWLVDSLSVRSDEAVHVGDSYRFDVEGAKRAGLRAVWFSRAPDEGKPGLADALIHDLAVLPDVIAAM